MTRTKSTARRRKLTELVVRKTKPEPKAFLVWDTVQRGLALRVHPTGRRSWVYIYRSNKLPRWLYLGDAEAIALGDARVLAAEAALEVARGRDPAAEKKAKRSEGTFADLARRYLEEHAKKHNKSWKQADKLIRRHVLPRWANLQASSIARADVKAMMRRMDAPILANQTLAAASAIFTWATKEEVLSVNPCRGVPRNETKSRERVLRDYEFPQFWNEFENAGVQGRALQAILLTGQRPGEICHMRREHIHGSWWEMPGDPVPELGWPGTKNGQWHRVYLPERVRSLVGEGTAGFVFPAPRGGAFQSLHREMGLISEKLGVLPLTPHDLRRTHGTTVTGLGFGRDAMNRIQNHKEGGIADVYDQHGYADENRRIMEAVAARIMALVEGKTADNIVAFARL